MTLDDFVRAEGVALRTFMDKHAAEDFLGRSMPIYTRHYRCDCGFGCQSPREIWRHVATAHAELRQMPLLELA